MAKPKKEPKVLVNGVRDGCFVKCWKDKREIVVQVWLSGKAEGEPDGDWAMPGVIGLDAAIDQSILQTRADNKK